MGTEKLQYDIHIKAEPQKVWSTMFDPKTYNNWAKAFSEGSRFEGEWQAGASLRFIDDAFGGTRAVLDVCEPPKRIVARHTAVISKDGVESTSGEFADNWVGTIETYDFTPVDEGTQLTVTMQCHSDFKTMLENSWPKALAILKELCEI